MVVNGSIWLVDDVAGSVTQYDAEAGTRIREIEVGPFPIEPVAAYGDVWTINHDGDSITRVDSETGEPYPAIELPGSTPLTITVVADDLMLVNGPDGSPTTWMVDPQRMELIGTFESTGCLKHYGYIGAAIDGLVWRQNCEATAVTIIDPRTGEQLESFSSPVAPYLPLYVDGDIWLPVVAGGSPGTVGLALLDTATHDVVRTYEQTAQVQEGLWFAALIPGGAGATRVCCASRPTPSPRRGWITAGEELAGRMWPWTMSSRSACSSPSGSARLDPAAARRAVRRATDQTPVQALLRDGLIRGVP